MVQALVPTNLHPKSKKIESDAILSRQRLSFRAKHTFDLKIIRIFNRFIFFLNMLSYQYNCEGRHWKEGKQIDDDRCYFQVKNVVAWTFQGLNIEPEIGAHRKYWLKSIHQPVTDSLLLMNLKSVNFKMTVFIHSYQFPCLQREFVR